VKTIKFFNIHNKGMAQSEKMQDRQIIHPKYVSSFC